MVFDYGGGTLDVTVLDIQGNEIVVKSTNGDTHCGGQDLDNCMFDECMRVFEEENNVDISNDQRAKARIRKACIAKKIELTYTESVDIQIDSLANECDLDMEMTRAEFEQLC